MNCENCFFCHSEEGYHFLECRRYPPIRNHPMVNGDSEFPYTQHHWWCGEWKAKKGEVNETVHHSLLDEC